MSRSLARILSVISAIVVVILVLALKADEGATLLIMLLYLPIALLLTHFQRCRHCGAWPMRGSFFHNYCPRCGEPYED